MVPHPYKDRRGGGMVIQPSSTETVEVKDVSRVIKHFVFVKFIFRSFVVGLKPKMLGIGDGPA